MLADKSCARVLSRRGVLLGGLAVAAARPMVGYDGEVWLDDLAAEGNRIEVQLPGEQRCETRFDLPAKASGPSRLGPLTCRLLSGGG